MRDRLAWLFSLRGTVTASQYVRWGLGLLALKAALDAMLCAWLLDRTWSPFLYVTPLPWNVLRGDGNWRWMLFAPPSVAFCWIGLAMTWRRLRDADVWPGLIGAFVLPYTNLLLIAVIALLPSVPPRRPRRGAPQVTPVRWPATGFWPAGVAAGVTFGLGFLSIGATRQYGGMLFFGLPVLQGLLVGVLSDRRSLSAACGQLALSMGLCVSCLLAIAAEGLVCILMTVPSWWPLGLVGLLLGRAVSLDRLRAVAPALLVIPAAQGLEPLLEPPATVYEVTSEVIVAASPAKVWQSLVEFDELPPPTELPFRLGIAFPIHATIAGRGPGAVRRCSFSTGDFVEPIEVWDEPRLLRFSVTDCPPPMREWNPFHASEDVHAGHLHGYFVARRGQFELVPLADGSTRLCGTTWYSHGLRPETYWRLWSDWLVHTIHGRVLEHIRRTAER